MKLTLVVFVLLMLYACAPLPTCAKWVGTVVQDREGAIWLVIDESNMNLLRNTLIGLRDQTCQVAK